MQIPLSAGIRQNRSKRYMTVVWCILLAFLLSAGGCSLVKIEEGERTPLEYTVVDTAELPQSAQELIQEKKADDFQMTYQKGDTLYLIRGYGKQMSGGYSIQVVELSASSTTIFFKTRLIGPEKENQSGAPSYPYIAVKTDYREEPVVFEEYERSGQRWN